MTDKLLPCPFCGGKADYCETNSWWVRCNECNAETEADMSPEAAAEIWNRRTPPSSSQSNKSSPGNETITGETARGERCELPPPPPPQTHVALPQDVIDLVIAAREALQYLYGMDGCELRSLDKAVEAFADRVPYENEPAGPEASEG